MRDPFGRPLSFDGTFPTGRLACPSVIGAALQTTDATAFLAVFGQGKFWGGPWGSELDAMSRDVRMLRMSDWLLWTRKHPDSFVRHEWLAQYGRDFERWLHELGAIDTARYVRDMLDLYPGGVPFPTEIERGKHLQALAKANPGIWKELRALYPGIENELAAEPGAGGVGTRMLTGIRSWELIFSAWTSVWRAHTIRGCRWEDTNALQSTTIRDTSFTLSPSVRFRRIPASEKYATTSVIGHELR